MVTVDISQLSGECSTWRDSLRSSRDELNNLKKQLQQSAGQNLSKAQLHDVEHLHNQFHIQLINVHDLKHAIKSHEQKISYEMNVNNGKLSHELTAEHDALLDQYQSLEITLQDLREEFDQFLSRTA